VLHESSAVMAELVKAHGASSEQDVARLRAMSARERGLLIESACEAAALICRSRLAAGLGEVQPDPWPPSTWEFLKKHAAHARS
jgi:hypothetical protein